MLKIFALFVAKFNGHMSNEHTFICVAYTALVEDLDVPFSNKFRSIVITFRNNAQ